MCTPPSTHACAIFIHLHGEYGIHHQFLAVAANTFYHLCHLPKNWEWQSFLMLFKCLLLLLYIISGTNIWLGYPSEYLTGFHWNLSHGSYSGLLGRRCKKKKPKCGLYSLLQRSGVCIVRSMKVWKYEICMFSIEKSSHIFSNKEATTFCKVSQFITSFHFAAHCMYKNK